MGFDGMRQDLGVGRPFWFLQLPFFQQLGQVPFCPLYTIFMRPVLSSLQQSVGDIVHTYIWDNAYLH
jgi:hypothetical protein